MAKKLLLSSRTYPNFKRANWSPGFAVPTPSILKRWGSTRISSMLFKIQFEGFKLESKKERNWTHRRLFSISKKLIIEQLKVEHFNTDNCRSSSRSTSRMTPPSSSTTTASKSLSRTPNRSRYIFGLENLIDSKFLTMSLEISLGILVFFNLLEMGYCVENIRTFTAFLSRKLKLTNVCFFKPTLLFPLFDFVKGSSFKMFFF